MADDTYLMLGDDGAVTVADLSPMLRRHRGVVVAARAAVIEPAAALFADPAFDLAETYEAAEAALTAGEVNAASYIGLVIREAELSGG